VLILLFKKLSIANMKNNFLLVIIVLFAGLSFLSCKKVKDFLDKPPGIDINEDIVFSAKIEAEKYVANLYQYGMHCPFPLRAADAGFNGFPSTGGAFSGNMNTATIGITDEGEASESFAVIQDWNTAAVTPQNIVSREDQRYFLRWMAIRVANILIERINEVPDADQAYKDMVKGEALFIRALNNFETFKRYGGFPIVNKRIITLDESRIPRSTVEECVNAIVKDCDDAVALLPVTQPSNFTGRAHQGAALALKSRTLLYAASPLFNTATPYLSFGNAADDKLICYGNVDNNRWKMAADASRAVIDWADGAGYALVDDADPLKRSPVPVAGQKVVGNYRTSWEQNDNTEIILASKIYGTAKRIDQFPWQYFLPRSDYVPNASGNWTAPTVTFNFVRKYEKRDGTMQTWDYAGGNNLLDKYSELDPRFCQTVCYTGARLHSSVTQVQIWEGASSNKANCKGGAWISKFINDALPQGPQFPVCPIFRVNEILLNYAEALNEFSGPSAEAYEAINKIRTRSGMPDITGLSQQEFRQKIHNERDIELAFEDHRLFDIKRWMIAEQDGVMTGSMWGLEINKLNDDPPFPTAFRYKPFVFETRTFLKKMYLHPYDNNEVLKGNLKQNPGW